MKYKARYRLVTGGNRLGRKLFEDMRNLCRTIRQKEMRLLHGVEDKVGLNEEK